MDTDIKNCEYGLEKIFEDLNLIECYKNDIGPAVRENE
jgi:hypothetical protein